MEKELVSVALYSQNFAVALYELMGLSLISGGMCILLLLAW